MEPKDPLTQPPFQVDSLKGDPIPGMTTTIMMLAQETLMHGEVPDSSSRGNQQVLLQEPQREDPRSAMLEKRWELLTKQNPNYAGRIGAARRIIEVASKVSHVRRPEETFDSEFTQRVLSGSFSGDESKMRGVLGIQEGQPLPRIGARSIIERILTAPGFS